MQNIWSTDAWAIVIAASMLALLGILTGEWFIASLITLGCYIAWLYYRLLKLEKWIRNGTKTSQVLLWDKVKDHLKHKATELSLEEQQKLCIARWLPVKPSILLMDEPCSALDPKGTAAAEELIWELRGKYSILIVTHNMAQARRASEECIFMLMGKVIEHTDTADMFVTPQHKETADYIEGHYG